MEMGVVGGGKRVFTPDELDWLRANYPDRSDAELAEHLGCSVYTIKGRRWKMGLRKSAEYMSRLNREKAIACGNAARLNTPEAVSKRADTVRRQVEQERIRLKWGLEQKTGRHLRQEPRGRLLQRNRLRRLGYVVDEKNMVAYWTAETHRAVRLERLQRGEKKGSIKCWYSFAEFMEK